MVTVNAQYILQVSLNISRPTRTTSRSATLIDNIFVNSLEDNFNSGLLFTDLSDHLPIFQITTSFTHTTPNKKTNYRKLTNGTLDLLNRKLEGENRKTYTEKRIRNTHTLNFIVHFITSSIKAILKLIIEIATIKLIKHLGLQKGY